MYINYIYFLHMLKDSLNIIETDYNIKHAFLIIVSLGFPKV
jgi:hypothetical protein